MHRKHSAGRKSNLFLEIVRGKNILRKGVLFKKIVLLGTVSLILILLALYGTGAAADVYGASAKIRIKNISKETVLKKGEKKKIKYRVKGAKKKYGKLLFRTSNKKIATVSKKGKIKAKKKGKVTITAYFRNRKRIKKSVRITVGKKVSEIKLTKIDNSRIFEPNESSKISAKVYPSDAGNKRLKWVSSNNAIAKVDSKGRVSFLDTGNVTISVISKQDNRKYRTVSFVVGSRIKTLKVKGETDMLIGTKERLTTEITPLKATKQTFTWKSSNSKILKVNSKGEVKAVGLGVATITASTVDGSKRKEKVKMEVVNLKKSLVKFIAHRGLHDSQKENTKGAFIEAGKAGFWGVECDVWETAERDASGSEPKEERDIVISHDRTFDRVFDAGSDIVYDMTKSEIQSKVPEACFIDEYLTVCREYGMVPIIEIKYDFIDNEGMSDEGIKLLVDKVNAHGLLKTARFISFDLNSIKRTKAYITKSMGSSADIYTSYILSRDSLKRIQKTENVDFIKAVREAKNNGITSVSINRNHVTDEIVNEVKQNALNLDLWTYNKSLKSKIFNDVKAYRPDTITTDEVCWDE